MFAHTKKSGNNQYLHIVENHQEGRILSFYDKTLEDNIFQ